MRTTKQRAIEFFTLDKREVCQYLFYSIFLWFLMISVAMACYHAYYCNSNDPLDLQTKPEKPLSIYERFLEYGTVCDIMHVFLTNYDDSFTKVPGCECSFNKTKKLEVKMLTSLVIDSLMIFLLYLTLVALYDICGTGIKREEEEARSSGKCSLTEYANMKHSRKNSAKDSALPRKDEPRPMLGKIKYESLGSAYTRLRRESLCNAEKTQVTGNDSPSTSATGSRVSLKLLGARPPLTRRSSVPAFVLLEGANIRRGSVESDDDSSGDSSRHRSRLIRRH